MMSPQKGDPNGPYPSVGGALTLTLMALLASGFTGIAFIDFGLLTAIGIGQAIGVGAVATLGAKRVAEPQAVRLGLRALDLEAIPMILCLVPAILLASELDNIATDWSGIANPITIESNDGGSLEGQPNVPLYEAPTDPSPEGDAPMKLFDLEDPASVIQAFVVIVGISPVVEEFLFRGVIQQGLLQRLGLLRGLSVVALLWTLLRPAPMADAARFVAAAFASFALGWALGLVRVATGSILGSILLASCWAAVGLGATILEKKFPLPGLNVEGTHLPLMVTVASVGVVAWAGWTMFHEAEVKFAEGHAEPGAPSSEDPDTTD